MKPFLVHTMLFVGSIWMNKSGFFNWSINWIESVMWVVVLKLVGKDIFVQNFWYYKYVIVP
jgi:hypothetical protein